MTFIPRQDRSMLDLTPIPSPARCTRDATPRSTATIWAMALIALAFAAAACGGTSTSGHPSRASATGLGTFEFPRDADVSGVPPLSAEEEAVIRTAEQTAIAACMRDKGFAYTPPASTPTVIWYRDPTTLETSGYGLDARDFDVIYGGSPSHPESSVSQADADARSSALDGDDRGTVAVKDAGGSSSWSTGGCRGAARRTVYGSVENAVRFDRSLPIMTSNQAVTVLRDRPDYAAAMTSWQRCMNQHEPLRAMAPTADVRFSDNDDYGINTLGRIWTLLGNATDAALTAMAKVDGGCQRSSGLDALRSQRIDAARDRLLAAAGIDVDTFNAYARWVVRRAQSVPAPT